LRSFWKHKLKDPKGKEGGKKKKKNAAMNVTTIMQLNVSKSVTELPKLDLKHSTR
jgi:hypothetical protein